MIEKDWIKFKATSEEKFKTAVPQKNCWGFQLQKNTKWNNGLNTNEIEQLEKYFGFSFPVDYIEMLKALNGFETLQISIDPKGRYTDEFQRRCYKYPDDVESTKWLFADTVKFIDYAHAALNDAGYDPTQIEGYIPLYGHRALVVFKDKQLSPVLSIWGDDIIVYGNSLIDYWCNEFHINFGHSD